MILLPLTAQRLRRSSNRLEAGTLSASDTRLISRLLRLLLKLINLVEQKNSSISRLKRLLFGPGSDTRPAAASTPEEKKQDSAAVPTPSSSSTQESPDSTVPPKRKGHLVKTCHQNGTSAWDYLVCLVRHARAVRGDPSQWLPWNYAVEEVKRRAAA